MRKKWMLSSTAIETITSIQVPWEVLPRTSSAFSTWAAMSGNGVKTSSMLKTKTVCCVVHVGTMGRLRAFFTPRIDTTRHPIREVIIQAFVVSWLGNLCGEAPPFFRSFYLSPFPISLGGFYPSKLDRGVLRKWLQPDPADRENWEVLKACI